MIGIDCRVCVQAMRNDIEQLERVVHILAYGDIAAENTRHLSEINFTRIFRLAQLALEYLLHVQDVLSNEKVVLLESLCALLLNRVYYSLTWIPMHTGNNIAQDNSAS